MNNVIKVENLSKLYRLGVISSKSIKQDINRWIAKIQKKEDPYDITFIGGLNKKYQTKRSECIEYIAGKVNFKWWGYGATKYPFDHPINKTWQGVTSGIEMFQIYKQSKIVFNDYIEVNEGMGINQRMFEVMGVGSLLLTREAENIKRQYPNNIFVTFKDEKDCLYKIGYFLKNEKEREEIALAGQKYVLDNFTYEKLMKEIDIILRESYNKKFSMLRLK